jgi:hypothetical protein
MSTSISTCAWRSCALQIVFFLSTIVIASGQRGGTQGPPPTPRAAAPIDLTGYWVSIVTEDWRWRMVTPAKGDYASVPLNPEGKKLADTWDPAKDEASGDQCKSYGAAGLMRLPERVHIFWDNDTTLHVDVDAGQQTRIFSFASGGNTSSARSWQGRSVAVWDTMPQGRGIFGGTDQQVPSGALKVVTTDLKSGYLRRNGVPYSENTAVTEYYNSTTESNGDRWLFITTIVSDPKYLTQSFITSSNFRREPDGAKWHPTPCSSR